METNLGSLLFKCIIFSLQTFKGVVDLLAGTLNGEMAVARWGKDYRAEENVRVLSRRHTVDVYGRSFVKGLVTHNFNTFTCFFSSFFLA